MSNYVWQNPYYTGSFWHGGTGMPSVSISSSRAWTDTVGNSVGSNARGQLTDAGTYHSVSLGGSSGGWDESYNVNLYLCDHQAVNWATEDGFDILSGGGETLTNRFRVDFWVALSAVDVFEVQNPAVSEQFVAWNDAGTEFDSPTVTAIREEAAPVTHKDQWNPWNLAGHNYWTEIYREYEVLFTEPVETLKFRLEYDIRADTTSGYHPSFLGAALQTWETTDLELAVLSANDRRRRNYGLVA